MFRRVLRGLGFVCLMPTMGLAQSYQTAFSEVKFDRNRGPATLNGAVEVDAATGAASVTLPLGPGIGSRGLNFRPTLCMRVAPQMRISTTDEYLTLGSNFSEQQVKIQAYVDSLYQAGFGSATFSPGTLDLGTMASTVDRHKTSYTFPDGGGGRVLGELPQGMTAATAQALLARFGYGPEVAVGFLPGAGSTAFTLPAVQMGSDGSLVIGLKAAGSTTTVTDEVIDNAQIYPDPPIGTPQWNFPRRFVVIKGGVAHEYHYVDHTYMTRNIPYLAISQKTQLYRAHYVLTRIRNRLLESIDFAYDVDGIGYTATWSTRPSVKIRVSAVGIFPAPSSQPLLNDSRFNLTSVRRVQVSYLGISQPVSTYHLDLADPVTGDALSQPSTNSGPASEKANSTQGQRDYEMSCWGGGVLACQPVSVVEEGTGAEIAFLYGIGSVTSWGEQTLKPTLLAGVTFPTHKVNLAWEPYRFRLNYSPEAWGGVVPSSSSTRPAFAYGVVRIDDSDGTQLRQTRHERVVPTSNWSGAPPPSAPPDQWVDTTFYDAVVSPDGSVVLHRFASPPVKNATSGAEGMQNLAFIKALECEARYYAPGVDWHSDLTITDPATSSAYKWVMKDRFDVRGLENPRGLMTLRAVPYATRTRTWDRESRVWTEVENTNWDEIGYGWKAVHRIQSLRSTPEMKLDYLSLAQQGGSYQNPILEKGVYRWEDRSFESLVAEWFIGRLVKEQTTTVLDSTGFLADGVVLPDVQPLVTKTFNPTIDRVESLVIQGTEGQPVSTAFEFQGTVGLQATQLQSATLVSPGLVLSGLMGVSAYQYDANGYLAAITQKPNDSVALTVQQAQDEIGRPTSQTDMNGKVQRFSWDTAGRLSRITPSDGDAETVITYDDGDHRGITVARGQQVVQYRYNGFGELILERRKGPDGTWSRRLVGRDVLGRETGSTIWLPDGMGVESDWSRPNLTQDITQTTTTSKTICKQWGFDDNGSAICLNWQTVESTTTNTTPAAYPGMAKRYDGRNRIVWSKEATGVSTAEEYHGPEQLPPGQSVYVGPVHKVTVGGTMIKWLESDAAGRSVRITTPVTDYAGRWTSTGTSLLNLQTEYRYDGGDRIKNVKQIDQARREQTRTWKYNRLGWLTDLIQPESGTTSYSGFTVAGTPTVVSYAGRIVRTTPDWMGRPQAIQAEDGSVSQSFRYDSALGGKGRLASSRDGDVTTDYAYGATGGRLSELKTTVLVQGVTQPPLTQSFTYDEYGNRRSGCTGHATWNQTFHAAASLPNQLTLGAQPVASTPWSYYDPISWALKSVAYGNHAASSFAYGPDQFRLAGVKHMDGSMGIQADWSYEYDNVGNLFREYDRTKPDGAGGYLFDQYSYDELNRLVAAVVQTTSYGEQLQQFDYDAFGNRIASNLVRVTSWSGGRGASTAAIGTSPLLGLASPTVVNLAFTEGSSALLQNRLPSTTSNGALTGAVYDGQGNLVQIFEKPGDASKADTMAYDALGRVIRLSSTRTGLTERYHYTTEGLRTVVEVYAANTLQKTRVNLYDDGRRLVSLWEKPPSGSLTWKRDIVYLGSREAAEFDAVGMHVTQVDHLGSPRVVTGPTGVVEGTQKFLPFGERIEQSGPFQTAKGFTNHEQTDASGLIYMQARFYLPWLGRFTAPDPARDQHFEDTQSWNIYSYVRNNPIMSIDPTGMVAGGPPEDSNESKSTPAVHARRNGADNNEEAVVASMNVASKRNPAQAEVVSLQEQGKLPTAGATVEVIASLGGGTNPSGVGLADTKAHLGELVGNGECVTYVKAVTPGLGNTQTSRWKAAEQVKGASLAAGTAIMTSTPGGGYPSGKSPKHGAIYLGQNTNGIKVLDQWAERKNPKGKVTRSSQVVHERTIRFTGKGGVDDANSYFVIKTSLLRPMYANWVVRRKEEFYEANYEIA